MDEHIVYILLMALLGALGAGRILGLDTLIETWRPVSGSLSWGTPWASLPQDASSKGERSAGMISGLHGKMAPTDYEIGKALREMPYGMYIVGSRMDYEVNGMMADWVMQVSFVPRMIAVSIENDARTLINIRASSVFSVNLLAEDSMALAAKFAQPYYGSKIRGRGLPAAAEIHHKLGGVSYRLGETGCPILTDTLAWFECVVETLLPVGDHTLVLGRLVTGGVARDAEPLTSTITGWVYSG